MSDSLKRDLALVIACLVWIWTCTTAREHGESGQRPATGASGGLTDGGSRGGAHGGAVGAGEGGSRVDGGAAGVGDAGEGGASGSGGAAEEGGGAGSNGVGGEGGSLGTAGAGGGPAGDGGSAGETELAFTELPRLAVSEDPSTPHYAELTFATNKRTRVLVKTTTGDRSWEHDFAEPRFDHVHTVYRFLPDNVHVVTLLAEDERGAVLAFDEGLEVRTPPLPASFPELNVPLARQGEIEPGVTLTSISNTPAAGAYLMILDELGEVIWYHYDPADGAGDLRRLPNGNLLEVVGRSTIRELDLRGQPVRSFIARGPQVSHPVLGSSLVATTEGMEVETDSFHHDASELASGNLLTLTSEMRPFLGYPTSETDPSPRLEPLNVVGDVVLEVSPKGETLGRWSLLDLLDPYRVGWNSFDGWWNDPYADPTNIDWGHANAVIVDPRDQAFIVSVRNQDTVVKFTRAGELRWLLSDPTSWASEFTPYLLKPASEDFAWQYHQHAPEITARGTLLVFDNGDRRSSPPDPGMRGSDRYSRVVEFAIDEEALSVAEVWDYGTDETPHFFAGANGDVDELPQTGNILVTIGAILGAPEGEPSAILREVTRTDPPRVVFELRVEDDNSAGPARRRIYRAERLPDIYLD